MKYREIYPEEPPGKVPQIAMPLTPQVYAQGVTGKTGPGGMERAGILNSNFSFFLIARFSISSGLQT
jgi:hypothetical protein